MHVANFQLKVKVHPAALQRPFLTPISKEFRNGGLPAQSIASNRLKLSYKI
jgi:hypothetical protein